MLGYGETQLLHLITKYRNKISNFLPRISKLPHCWTVLEMCNCHAYYFSNPDLHGVKYRHNIPIKIWTDV